MELRTVVTLINAAAFTAYAAVLFRKGYRRRRDHWSPGSWLGLSLTLLGGLALVGFALVFSAGVDNRVAWVGTPRSDTRILWIVAAAASLVGGAIVLGAALSWFARGRPTTPFPLARRRPRPPARPAVDGDRAVEFVPSQPNHAAEAVAARVEHR